MLSTDPQQETPLVLKERRPFALEVKVETADRTPLDLTDCELELVIAKPKRKGGTVVATSDATIVSAVDGLASFLLQGSEVNFGAGLYELAITLTTAEDYAVSIVEGPVELTANPDPTVPGLVTSVAPPLGVTARLLKQNKVVVRVDHQPDSGLRVYAEQAVAAAVQAGTIVVDATAANAAAQQSATSAAAAAIAAGTAKDAAAASAAAAEGFSANLAAAVAAAQAAKTSAEAARDSALTSQNSAGAFRDEAEAAKDIVEVARDAAINASDLAADAKADAEAAAAAAQAAYNSMGDELDSIPARVDAAGANLFVNQRHDDAEHVHTIRVMTQAAYDALGSTVSTTLYVIKG